MGKKTNEFIANMDTVMNECRRYLGDYCKAADKLVELDVKQLKELRERHGDKEGDRVSDNDPGVQTCRNQLYEYDQQVDESDQQRKAAGDEIYNRLSRIQDRTAAFEAYIKKKEKSKNPFKSKKSIPSAKVYIDAVRQFHASMDQYYRKSIGFRWY